MSLVSGTRIGCYEISGVLGAGGMGEVYRARDTKLGRDVALKVLPDVFANDADRTARFQREAQLLASLSHPNIGAIHGIEDAGPVRALVLELIEGDTLADRIRRGPLAVDEAMVVARQIADALEAAHERGVIHRDLKPANVKIMPDGKVKVLDFGLAKAMDTAPSSPHVSHSPTLSLAGTLAGMVLGTAAYMSPEQAKGLPADRRSDVFSFGCVLYEMLTGRQVFQADTAPETLAAVLMRAPDLDGLPSSLPPRLRALVQRCLEKDAKRRWQAVGDLRFELEAIASDPLDSHIAATPRSDVRPSLWRRAMPAVVAAVVVGATAASATWWSLQRARVPAVTRFRVALEDVDAPLQRTSLGLLTISPNGDKIVFGANRQLYMRSMADLEARAIPGTNLDVVEPFFSPDGQWIGFFSLQDSTLKKIAVTGGAALTLCKADGAVSGASWEGNTIAFAQPGKGILRVSADGGQPEIIAGVGTEDVLYGPQLLEDGRSVLFAVTEEAGSERWDKAQIVIQSVGSADRKVVVRGGAGARYVSTGHLVYAVGGSVLAVPFDLRKRETRGGPVPVIEGVMRAPNPAVMSGVVHFAISASGSLVYLPGVASGTGPKSLAFADRTGRVELLGLPPRPYIHPRLSPNGAQLVVETDDGKEAIVWVYDLKAGGSLRRLTFGGRNEFPIWSRDGRYITFRSDRDGDAAIFRQSADGLGVPERLTTTEQGSQQEPESWSPDGKTLSFNLVRGANQGVWTWSFDGDRKSVMFVDVPNVVEKHSVFSPNGKWLAYMSARLAAGIGIGGGGGVFVEPFPPTGAKYQVASSATRTPLWSPDGRQLFYHDPSTNRLFVVDVRTEPSFTFGTPVSLPIEGTVHPIAQRNYDITADGQRILVVLPGSAAGDTTRRSSTQQQMTVVLDWFEELKTRVPIK